MGGWFLVFIVEGWKRFGFFFFGGLFLCWRGGAGVAGGVTSRPLPPGNHHPAVPSPISHLYFPVPPPPTTGLRTRFPTE